MFVQERRRAQAATPPSHRGMVLTQPMIRLPGWVVLICLLWWAGFALTAWVRADPELNLLTNCRQVLDLSAQEAEKGYPVRLKGVLVCHEPTMSLSFLIDQTACVYLYLFNPSNNLSDGDLVEVDGRSNVGKFAPIVMVSNLTVVGKSPLPRPRPISNVDLISTQLDAQWVDIEGIVHVSKASGVMWYYDLSCGDKHLPVWVVRGSATDSPPDRDALIKVQGVIMAQVENGQFNGYKLMAPASSFVTVVEPGATDPFKLPPQTVRSLMSYANRQSWGHQVHAQGIVTLHVPGGFLYVKDAGGGFRVKTDQAQVYPSGTRVDLIGFPQIGKQAPQLDNCVIRGGSVGPSVKPIILGAADQLTLSHDSELVRLEGELYNIETGPDGRRNLFVKRDELLIKARLLNSRDSGAPVWRTGSMVRLTGVCSVELEDVTTPRFSMWINSPLEVEVLRPPKEFWSRRLLVGAGVLVGGVVAAMVWLLVLRRQVQLQTAAIRRRESALDERYRDLFENAHDIIFTHDLAGKFSTINRAGELTLGISRQMVRTLNILDCLTAEDRETYQQLLTRHNAGETQGHCELELTVNQHRQVIWEVNTRLDIQDGQPVGIRAIAKDVTQRRQSEDALRRSEQELRCALEARQRIAQDLHDDIIQSIYAVGLGLEDCRKRLKDAAANTEERLKTCLTSLNRIIRNVRSFIGNMDTDAVSNANFMAEMQMMVSTLRHLANTHIDLDIDPVAVARLGPRQVPQILHIAREGLSNSLRHAHSNRIQLSLSTTEGRIRLEIRDNGRGFNVVSVGQQGSGLRNITARAFQLGANLNVESKPGEGTSITLDLAPNESNYGSN